MQFVLSGSTLVQECGQIAKVAYGTTIGYPFNFGGKFVSYVRFIRDAKTIRFSLRLLIPRVKYKL